jgi:diacylglycerol kinase family enzyme
MRGTHVGLPEVEYFTAREIRLESTPPADVMVDADAAGTTPATFRVLPGALRVLVPATA